MLDLDTLHKDMRAVANRRPDAEPYYALLACAYKLRDVAIRKLTSARAPKTVERYTKQIEFQNEVLKMIRTKMAEDGFETLANNLLNNIFGVGLGATFSIFNAYTEVVGTMKVEGVRCTDEWIILEGTNEDGRHTSRRLYAEEGFGPMLDCMQVLHAS